MFDKLILMSAESGSNPLVDAISAFFSGIGSLLSLAVTVLLIIANWRIFTKAGEAGWKSIIPIYSTYILFKIIYGNGWKFLLLIVPLLNIAVGIAYIIRLAQVFGHSAVFGIGMLLFPNIFTLILAFDNSSYLGPIYSFL